MPVNEKRSIEENQSSRKNYNSSFFTKLYWDFRDRFLLHYIDNKTKHILDVGCGEGITLEKISKRYPDKEILGIDIMEDNLRITRVFGLNVNLGNIYELDLPDNSFDLIYLS